MRVTGRFEFRRSWTGKVVLQVEEEVEHRGWPWSKETTWRRRWRDANSMDLSAPDFRELVDLRVKPQFLSLLQVGSGLKPLSEGGSAE